MYDTSQRSQEQVSSQELQDRLAFTTIVLTFRKQKIMQGYMKKQISYQFYENQVVLVKHYSVLEVK